MERFSNLHYCTFKCFTDIQLRSNEVTSSVAFPVNNRFQTYFINMFSFMCFTCVKLFSFKKICFLRERLWWTHNLRLNTPEKTMTCSTHNNVLRYSTLSMKHIKIKFYSKEIELKRFYFLKNLKCLGFEIYRSTAFPSRYVWKFTDS